MIESFEKRVEAPRTKGYPDSALMMLSGVPIMVGVTIMVPVLPIKIMFGFLALCCFVGGSLVWYHYDDYLVWQSLWMGRKMKKAPELAPSDQFCYVDGFTWKSCINDHVIAHVGSSVSVAFTWDGMHDRFFSASEHQRELNRRIAFLKSLPVERGVVVENHLIRRKDDRLVDAYLAEGRKMDQEQPAPPIIGDIRSQIAELYRPMARSNSVMTVLSLGPEPGQKGVLNQSWSFLRNTATGRYRQQARLAAELMEEVDKLKSDFQGMRLLSKDEYADQIQRLQHPGAEPHRIDWRFNLAEQLATNKPSWEGKCIRVGDTFFASVLVQTYPNMGLGWVHGFVEAPVDCHICQIIIPKAVGKALDANKSQADFEEATLSSKRGTDLAISKLGDSKRYRQYVAQNRLPVADNAYIVTLSSDNHEELMHYANSFKRAVIGDKEGMVRDSELIQTEMMRVRLPGMGRSSYFFREDHGETVAAMMPFTTFDHGEDHPESLRISSSGQLVGYSPSTIKSPNSLVVAEMGGGKDTNEGTLFAETYRRIRYDFFELGNSYQGIVEAAGGHYCRAREQAINPLPAYDEYHSTMALVEQGASGLDSDFVITQANVLTPMINGMGGMPLTRPQRSVLERSVRLVYDNPAEGMVAPTLPLVLKAVGQVEPNSEAQLKARGYLECQLFEFLDSETGKRFCEKDQFVISPIANAIDFDKFSGELFEFYMTFIATRMVTNAMSRGVRSQIVLNEFKVLLQRAPDAIRWITLTLDSMGRKDGTGLTRITQNLSEIQSIGEEALNGIPIRTLLSRRDSHAKIGDALDMPPGVVHQWSQFLEPERMNLKGYREGFKFERGQWHKLHLQFPQLVLDLMNTHHNDKQAKEEAYRRSKDPYERIRIFKQIKAEESRRVKELHNEAAI